MPVSAWSLCCVTALLATKACTFSTAMSGLLNDSIWLIVIAFFVAKVRRGARDLSLSSSRAHLGAAVRNHASHAVLRFAAPCRTQALEKTGLGERIANVFVAAVGQSTLGVAYSLAVAEMLMAPAMPSCTARAGGIFMPVRASLFGREAGRAGWALTHRSRGWPWRRRSSSCPSPGAGTQEGHLRGSASEWQGRAVGSMAP